MDRPAEGKELFKMLEKQQTIQYLPISTDFVIKGSIHGRFQEHQKIVVERLLDTLGLACCGVAPGLCTDTTMVL